MARAQQTLSPQNPNPQTRTDSTWTQPAAWPDVLTEADFERIGEAWSRLRKGRVAFALDVVKTAERHLRAPQREEEARMWGRLRKLGAILADLPELDHAFATGLLIWEQVEQIANGAIIEPEEAERLARERERAARSPKRLASRPGAAPCEATEPARDDLDHEASAPSDAAEAEGSLLEPESHSSDVGATEHDAARRSCALCASHPAPRAEATRREAPRPPREASWLDPQRRARTTARAANAYGRVGSCPDASGLARGASHGAPDSRRGLRAVFSTA